MILAYIHVCVLICINKYTCILYRGFSGVMSGKKSTHQCRRHGFNPWVRKIPWRRACAPTPVFLPGEFHRQKNLVGYSP